MCCSAAFPNEKRFEITSKASARDQELPKILFLLVMSSLQLHKTKNQFHFNSWKKIEHVSLYYDLTQAKLVVARKALVRRTFLPQVIVTMTSAMLLWSTICTDSIFLSLHSKTVLGSYNRKLSINYHLKLLPETLDLSTPATFFTKIVKNLT